MNRRSARSFAILLIVLGVAVAGWLVLRSPQPDAPARTSSLPTGGSLVSSLRGEPRSFNRFVARDSTIETITFLTQSRLVRVNRETYDVEPMLAERWTLSDDGLTYTLKLRPGMKFSDGAPFSSADVVFSFRAAYDERFQNAIGDSLRVGGKPLMVRALDQDTVTITFPAPFGPGLRIIDNLPIYPSHLLQSALDDGSFAAAWGANTPPSKLAGMGPFMVGQYQPGHRLVFDRNPFYWRKDANLVQLPYLDHITLEIVPDQNAELLRLQTGQIDCTQSEVRPEDYAMLKQAESAGRVRVYDVGAGLDADSFWINLRRDVKMTEARRAWLQHVEFRRAIAEAVDRQQFADTVFFGAAVPMFGPVSPANRTWYDANVPTVPFDPKHAAERLAAIGLKDRDHEGVLQDRSGARVRFTLVTQKGNTALERGANVIRDSLAKLGVAVDVVPLEVGSLIERLLRGDFEAMYYRFLITDLDPAVNLDFWVSSGSAHVWNPVQPKPTTDWEREVDEVMARQAAALDPTERRQLFGRVQRVFAEQVPILYFAAPRVYVATSTRLLNTRPSLLRPMVLWNADMLAVKK